VDVLPVTNAQTRNGLLPVRPKPIAGEATLGYLIRVTEANGYESIRQLWLALKTCDILIEATVISDLERQSLLGPFPGYWGNEINSQGFAISDFNHAHLRWCPLCLMDSKHLRGVWLLKLYCVCIQHKIYLHEQCSRCSSYQRLQRPNLQRCECGARFTSGTVVGANPELLLVTQAFESSILGQPSNSGLPTLTTQEWIRLAIFLGQFSENYQPTRPGKVGNLHELDTATALMSGLARLLENWPENFHSLLSVIYGQVNTTASLQRTFGSLYRVLYRQLKAPNYQFLRDAFEGYVQQHWEGVICKRNSSFKQITINAHPQLTIKQAAKKAGSDMSIIWHLIETEQIYSHRSQSAAGRKTSSIHQHHVSRIVKLTRNNVKLQEAGKILALPECRVRTLIRAGIIIPLISRKQTRAAYWQISRSQLSLLWFKPTAIATDEKTICITSILKHWRLNEDEFILLVKALIDQNIMPVAEHAESTAIGKLNLYEEQFRLWLSNLRYESTKTMTVDSTAKVLGLKQQVAYELVRAGLLMSSYDSIKGVRISTDQLQQFQETYISLAEIACNRGCSPRKLLLELQDKPVTGPCVDGNRQYFFRRSDIEWLDDTNALIPDLLPTISNLDNKE
jgi:TniQ